MKKNLLLIIVCIGVCSCNGSSDTVKIEREGEPTIYSITDEDQQMNAAIKKAVQSFDTFKTALMSNDENYNFFSVKQRFITTDGGEHIWLGEISIIDGELYGIVDNIPESTNEVNIGDTVKIENENISDWMYFDNGRVKGGYTIRVLRDKMTKEEQQQFDAETGLVFE